MVVSAGRGVQTRTAAQDSRTRVGEPGQRANLVRSDAPKANHSENCSQLHSGLQQQPPDSSSPLIAVSPAPSMSPPEPTPSPALTPAAVDRDAVIPAPDLPTPVARESSTRARDSESVRPPPGDEQQFPTPSDAALADAPAAPSDATPRTSTRLASRRPSTRPKRGITGAALDAARKKKRKADTPVARPDLDPSNLAPAKAVARDCVGPVPAVKAATRDCAGPVPSVEPVQPPTIDLSCDQPVSMPSSPRQQPISSVATTSTAESVCAAPAAFNLDAFMEGFGRVPPMTAPVPYPTPLSTSASSASMDTKMGLLFTMMRNLQEQIQSSARPITGVTNERMVTSATSAHDFQHHESGLNALSWTLPPIDIADGMPPPAIQALRCASFVPPRTRGKGEYYPPQAHQLGGHRLYRALNTPAGAFTTPMSFVLQLSDHECVRFKYTPAVGMAMYSAWFGSRGLTIIHFRPLTEVERLQRGSTNENFSLDFASGAALPVTAPGNETYKDLLAAISGLTSFGDAQFCDYV
ncbi:hypothetical protein PHYPSEUDO_010086 [Phytophthora pseudosyringae]|uniref:Uncharacterized protein n=1 Tax=Phytophthora pseudosyringae TaxID=221518 RepID=A0A8T1VE37_9STRA|nr:hypothetical protein PHYPSEUDO_010086 [Phytophthora pseudosyringae]